MQRFTLMGIIWFSYFIGYQIFMFVVNGKPKTIDATIPQQYILPTWIGLFIFGLLTIIFLKTLFTSVKQKG